MLLDDIYVMWIPILVVALMAALGAWRGVYREISVSASIVLSALIVMQWVRQDSWSWARDLSNTFGGLSVGEWQFYLTLVLMALLVAVMGYGLGGLFSRRSMSTTTRTLGGILGFANGAALCGWVLRAAYEGLVNKSDTSAVFQNPISQSLMVWAGWFPVALAVLGAIAALVYSVRGDKTTSPEAARPGALVSTAPTMPVYIPNAATVTPMSPAHASNPYQTGTDVFAAIPTGARAHTPMPTSMPDREGSAFAQTAAYPVVPPTASPAPRPATVAPHQPPQSPAYYASTGQPSPNVGWQPDIAGQTHAPLPTTHSEAKHTPPFGYNLSELWEGDAGGSTPSSASEGSPDAVSSSLPALGDSAHMASTPTGSPAGPGQPVMQCRNCGNPLQEGAIFCTECGTRV